MPSLVSRYRSTSAPTSIRCFRFHRWLANLRVLEINEVKTVPHVPVSHPFVERLIGTIRRELLDRRFSWNALDLERKPEEFRSHYNGSRVHQSLNGNTPAEQAGKPRRSCAALDRFGWREHAKAWRRWYAFAAFGGVARVLLYDNLRSAGLEKTNNSLIQLPFLFKERGNFAGTSD